MADRDHAPEVDLDVGAYCREIEAYLCRRNGGHLIRLVGPAFTMVVGWAEQGIPLRVAFQGIDQVCERRAAKGGRTRPVRIEFCEADVLAAFDDWRRKVGIGLAAAPPGGNDADPTEGELPPPRRTPSLKAHLERVIARLTLVAGDSGRPAPVRQTASRILSELDVLRARSAARGEERRQTIERLAALDEQLIAEARAALPDSERDEVRAEAARELEPFRLRMPREPFETAIAAAADRLLRQRLNLPTLTLE